jgi:methenyltetrahydrofolate cyclohydrolase
MAEELARVANRNVLGDVAAAAEAIRAAAATARILVEANLPGITDQAARDQYAVAVEVVDGLLGRAGAVSAAVRKDLSR